MQLTVNGLLLVRLQSLIAQLVLGALLASSQNVKQAKLALKVHRQLVLQVLVPLVMKPVFGMTSLALLVTLVMHQQHELRQQ
jgi:hypothetical protein